MLEKFKTWYRVLPDKKRYLEFVTALLTIPVLLTVIYSNFRQINSDKETKVNPASEKIIIVTNTDKPDQDKELVKGASISSTPIAQISPISPTPQSCKKEVGPIKISSPTEDEVVQDDMVCVKIDYSNDDYCSVSWSYKLDSNNWSSNTSSPFCFSKLDPGKHELDIRIQSTVSNDETTLERTFYYKTKEGPPTPTPQTSI